MEVEFKVESDHLSRDDPALEPAIDEYTSALWPFGRRNKAYRKLGQKQEELLKKHGIEEISELGTTILKITEVETEEEAWGLLTLSRRSWISSTGRSLTSTSR